MVSVTPGDWNHTTGVLPLTIEGNVGNILESGVQLVVSGAAAGLTVTNGTGGVITAVADLTATDIGVSGMTNFTLRTGSTATVVRHGVQHRAGGRTAGIRGRVSQDRPSGMESDQHWYLRHTAPNGNRLRERVAQLAINAYVPNDTTPIRDLSPTANTDYANTDVDGTLDDDGTIDTGVTLSTGFTEFSNQEIDSTCQPQMTAPAHSRTTSP